MILSVVVDAVHVLGVMCTHVTEWQSVGWGGGGNETGMNLVVRIMCPPYTVSVGRCGPTTELHGSCTLHSCH